MSPRSIILFILFYIVPLAIFAGGIFTRDLPLVLLGLIWLISAFVLNLMSE